MEKSPREAAIRGSASKTGAASDDIPDHLLVDLLGEFLHGDVNSFCSVSKVCKSWSMALLNEPFWQKCLISRFGPDERIYHPRRVYDSACPAKETYAATHSLERRFSSGDFTSLDWRLFSSPLTDILILEDCVYIGDSLGNLRLYQISNQSVSPLSIQPPTGGGVSCLGSLGEFIVSGHADGTVNIWSPFVDNISSVLAHERDSRVNSISACVDAFFASSSPVDMSVCVMDAERGVKSFSKRFTPESSPNSVHCLHPQLILVGSRDNAARIIDVRTRYGTVLSTHHLTDWCLCVEWANEFTFRASDKAVNLFDIRASGPIETRHAGDRLITRFKSDSVLRLVSCGLDGQVRISSLEDPNMNVHIQSNEDYILSVDFTRTALCCGGINGLFQSFVF